MKKLVFTATHRSGKTDSFSVRSAEGMGLLIGKLKFAFDDDDIIFAQLYFLDGGKK